MEEKKKPRLKPLVSVVDCKKCPLEGDECRRIRLLRQIVSDVGEWCPLVSALEDFVYDEAGVMVGYAATQRAESEHDLGGRIRWVGGRGKYKLPKENDEDRVES